MTVILLYSFVPLFATNLCATSFCTIKNDSSQYGKLSINQKMIGDVILYGIFPITFGLLMSMSLMFVFNMSWFKSGKWDIAKFCLIDCIKSMSISTIVRFLVFKAIFSDNAPWPGPISNTSLWLFKSTVFIIFSSRLLSTKKFCPHFFFANTIYMLKKFCAFLVVASAIFSKLSDLISAIFSAIVYTWKGSFFEPLNGCGARNGQSVSKTKLFNEIYCGANQPALSFSSDSSRFAFTNLHTAELKGTNSEEVNKGTDLGGASTPCYKINKRLSDIRTKDGKQLINNKKYTVCGWASVNSEETGKPIWDITREYLSDIKYYDLADIKQPQVLFEDDNFGLET